MTPLEGDDPKNSVRLRYHMEKYYSKNIKKQKPKFKVGSRVKINMLKSSFSRGYNIQAKDEIFIVSEVVTDMPVPLYKVKVFSYFFGSILS